MMEISMSGYVWDLSGTDGQCDLYAPGHQIHWIHFNHSMREPSVVIPVTAVVDDEDLVHIEGDDLSLVRWNHRPTLLRAALQRFGGRAHWKPRWYILAVPTDAFMGSASSVFSMAAADERRQCHAFRRADSESRPSCAGTPARQRHVQKIWAEQEAKNAELRKIDFSHIPRLRINDRYAGGREKRNIRPSSNRLPTGPTWLNSLSQAGCSSHSSVTTM
jgi:hypothetical protein